MSAEKNKTGSVKGKIIIASVLACFALFLAWSTSKEAFKTVLNSFDRITAPNDKIRLINEISVSIARLNQGQKAIVSKKSDKYNEFLVQAKKLDQKIDTLRSFYPDRPYQVKRLNTLKKLLDERDKLYIDYLNVRSGLIDYKSFESQVESLNHMVNQSALQNDSVVTTSVKKTATTTFYPATLPKVKKTERQGFFKRLFGKKDDNNQEELGKEEETSKPFSVVDSVFNIKQDTIALAMRDSMLKSVGRTIQHMERAQQTNSAMFVRKETMLNKASTKIIGQAQLILKKIENEAITQANASNKSARRVVKNSIERIGLIMLLFFALICVLVYLILRDVSRINRYRQQIEAAKEEAEYHALAKHRFLSNMSHEIRTPLQSILGYAELVKKQQGLQPENIDAIYSSSHHLLHIVNEVLDYNRIISGKFTFTREAFDVQQVLNEVVSVLRPQANNKEILLKCFYEPQGTNAVYGDPFRLKQVLFNLAGNAIKFTSQGEVCINVTAVDYGDNIGFRFDVTDTGNGLSRNDINRIFNEFEQAGDEKEAKKGTGLGLAISKQLIELQGGQLSVKSQLGQGSCFTIEQVFDKAPAQSIAIPDDVKSDEISYPAKVWIVDDDPFILDLTKQLCREHGIQCQGFNSPSEILNVPWDNEVGILFIDIRMPEMSGIELCHLMRSRVAPGTLIYALTAQVMADENQGVLKGGFDGILSKPFTENGLITLLKSHVSKKPAQESAFDPRAIERMTFGDPEVMVKVLNRFIEDSQHDIDELRRAAKKQDVPVTNLLLHRIAGRTAQFGEKQLSQRFRVIEIRLNATNILTTETVYEILLLCTHLHSFAERVNNYNVRRGTAI
jgi:signal transduction histidine kinase/DNA-binding response OmpR family regulator